MTNEYYAVLCDLADTSRFRHISDTYLQEHVQVIVDLWNAELVTCYTFSLAGPILCSSDSPLRDLSYTILYRLIRKRIRKR